jgi:hypothetical protein
MLKAGFGVVDLLQLGPFADFGGNAAARDGDDG